MPLKIMDELGVPARQGVAGEDNIVFRDGGGKGFLTCPVRSVVGEYPQIGGETLEFTAPVAQQGCWTNQKRWFGSMIRFAILLQ